MLNIASAATRCRFTQLSVRRRWTYQQRGNARLDCSTDGRICEPYWLAVYSDGALNKTTSHRYTITEQILTSYYM
jgi:hypothetical protein